MKPSLTYYLTITVLKLKGIKNVFSKDPIDHKKLRKEDIFHPKGNFYKTENVSRFTVLDSEITEIAKKNSEKLLLFIHGGAFISGPAKHHWDSIKTIYKQTNYSIWLCNYPKAPENNIKVISKNIDSIYEKALELYNYQNIVLIGDSVGATLTTALTQRLILNKKPLPYQIILISPVMDSSMTNPEIDALDTRDVMLSKKGVLSSKKLCAQGIDLKNPMISPLYGSFKGFPLTTLFIAEYDIVYPDQKLAIEKLISANVKLEIIEGKKMPHVWPLLPIMKEAKMALNKVIHILNQD
ncbi:alpha/beta hydrolase fold domain-containing protein [Tenacibaculum xiamenense]|uniref:alpha/beta hydrolase fold domain-containing protein n=1 Tax=Tenacibaculum xiamenense TaxID=1261553 RepID=UPI003894A730